MKYIPNWVIDALMSKKFSCYNCNSLFSPKHLTGLGIREREKVESFFIELNCPGCRKVTFFEMQPMNVVEFSENVLDEVDADLDAREEAEQEYNEMDLSDLSKNIKKDVNKEAEKQKTSKITLKDIRSVVNVLKPKNFEHEHFLEMLGLTPEQIELYKDK